MTRSALPPPPPPPASTVELDLADDDVIVLADATEEAPEYLARTWPMPLKGPMKTPATARPIPAAGVPARGPILLPLDASAEDALAEEVRAAFARALGEVRRDLLHPPPRLPFVRPPPSPFAVVARVAVVDSIAPTARPVEHTSGEHASGDDVRPRASKAPWLLGTASLAAVAAAVAVFLAGASTLPEASSVAAAAAAAAAPREQLLPPVAAPPVAAPPVAALAAAPPPSASEPTVLRFDEAVSIIVPARVETAPPAPTTLSKPLESIAVEELPVQAAPAAPQPMAFAPPPPPPRRRVRTPEQAVAEAQLRAAFR